MNKGETSSFRRRGVFYVLLFLVIFAALIACGIGGLYLYYRNRDFYQAFRLRLSSSFYLSAAGVLFLSSVLYTPFSYGISYYFLRSFEGKARFSALFFLFCRPSLLLKAIAVSMGKKVFIYLERLWILLAASLLEVVMFFLFLLFKGEDLFGIEGNPFILAAEFMAHTPPLIVLSVLLWCGVLLAMVLSSVRYVLCKYLLLSVQDAGVGQVLKVGKQAIKGRLLQTLIFYLRYVALLLLGLFSSQGSEREPFSIYAERLAKAGWREYCRKRSLR
ncbi:MAG: hypothetical protein IJ294_02360 [Clostridia bacterium]|nr:hypothetical protein [Clostridia bacterium]